MLGADDCGSDEYCPHCDNHFVIDAVTPKAALQVEGDDPRIDSRYVSSTGAAFETLLCELDGRC